MAKTIEFPNGEHAELAADGTITGTCQLTGGYIVSGVGYFATVILPDGARLPAGCYESYIGVPDHSNYIGPCDGTYSFKATKKDGGYFVYVYSQNAAAPAPGALVSSPPPGYTYQHAYGEHWNPVIVTNVAFKKSSDDESLTNMNVEYALAGATYDIHEEESGAKVATIATDVNGSASCKLTAGKRYYAVETVAPQGYVLDSKRVSFTAGEGTVNLADSPICVEVSIQKADSATGGAAQAGLSLAGASFKLVDARGVPQEATTDERGKAKFSPIPLGSFSIVETKAPEGYKLDTTIREYHVGADAEHKDGIVSFTAPAAFSEDVCAFDLELAKFKEDPSDDEGGVRLPAEGVQFQVISGSTGDVVTTLATDVYGFARTPEGAWYGAGTRPDGVNGSIPYDRKGYVVREVASTVPEGYEHMDDFTISVEEQVDGVRLKYIIENTTPDTHLQIVKTDAHSNRTVPLAGFGFRLLDADGKPITQSSWYPNHVELDTFTTDDSGCVTLPEQLVPGTYYVEETATQPPYLLNKEKLKVTLGGKGGAVAVVRFFDKQARGEASIEKTDAETGEALAGAAFDVIAQDDVISPDGTVQAVAGEIVAQVTTDKKGRATAKQLPLGTGEATYAFVETQPPTGYVLDSTPHAFTLSYKDGGTDIVKTRVGVSNEPVTFIVEKTELGSGKPLEQVEFCLEAVDEEEGEKTRATTDEHGRTVWKRLATGSYDVTEQRALEGYVRDQGSYRITVMPDGTVAGEALSDGKLALDNDFTKIDISKRDITNEEELPGAHLAIIDEDENVIERWVSAAEPHRVERLSPGTYTLVEERTPATHDAAESVTFEVAETGNVQKVVMYDEPIEITAQIDKRQEIARPVAPNVVANGDGLNQAEPQTAKDGSYSYALDWRNTSNTWVDEFTVDDNLFCVENGFATLDGLTTPVAVGDYDGLMNVWFKTNREHDGPETAKANATLSDGHVNPWLSDPNAALDLGDDGRALSYEVWRLWRADVPTDEASELLVADLGLEDGEEVCSVRFEYGRVEPKFTTRKGGWDRDELKALHDDFDDVTMPLDTGDTGSPAVLHMRATDAYAAEVPLHNYAQVGAFRNGGGEKLEAHDYDEVEQLAGTGTKPKPVVPKEEMPQTGDATSILVALMETAGVTTIAAGLAMRRRRQSKKAMGARHP